MCEPATIAYATFALASVSAVSTVVAQQQQASAQAQRNATQRQNEISSYNGNLANIEVQRNQMQQDATEKVNLNNSAARAANANAKVSAGEAGVSGLSVEALLRDLSGEAAYDNTNVESNYLRQNTALNYQRENALINTNSQINSLQTPTSPDYLGAGLRIGQAGLSSYSGYQQQQAIIAGRK